MTTLYKLTDAMGRTRAGEYNELTWAVGIVHKATGVGNNLCSHDVIHAYLHPMLAVLLNPLHAGFDPNTMRLFECEGDIVVHEHQLKCGVKQLHIIKELPLPQLTITQVLTFGILCSKKVCTDPTWLGWADSWLNKTPTGHTSRLACRVAVMRGNWAAWFAARACEDADLADLHGVRINVAQAAKEATNISGIPLDMCQIAEQVCNS